MSLIYRESHDITERRSSLARPSLLGPQVLPLEDEVPVEAAAEVGAGADVLEARLPDGKI